MMKVQKERKFKKEYIPVIVLALILILLLTLLVVVIMYEKKDYKLPNMPEYEYVTNEILVDTSNSTCSAVEIDKLYQSANKVTFKYAEERVVVGKGVDVITGEEEPTYGYVFNVQFSNITEDIYIRITNDNLFTEKKIVQIKAKDAEEGKYTYQTEYTDDVVTYTVEIYTSNEHCQGELFRKFTFETPIYNRLAGMDLCQEFKEFEYCQKFITKDRPSMDQFYEKLYAYIEKEKIDVSDSMYIATTTKKNPNKTTSKTTTSKEENKKPQDNKKDDSILLYACIGGAVVLVAVVAIVVIVRRKRK